ncbi:hypothetical protein E0500_024190 [Streptomyces sp. KM273126]|nr:hypothetical protein [Streptomyces sp. KM273126]MBA2810409.1 hypothetical protein [Streptomyces sp. KM273126]
MTTHHTSKPAASPTQPIERAVMAGLVLAVIAALAWIGGMLYTVTGWSS